MVEVLGEGLEVDVGRVDLGVELAARLGVDVARGDGHGLETARVARVGDVHGVLGEDGRIVVGERDAPAAGLLGGARDGLGARLIGEAVHVARLGDVPVLAELAREVAARRAEREHARARVEVLERLLLDGIDAEPGRAAVGREHHGVAFALAHEAEAALPVVEAAVARAEVALDAAVVLAVPPACRMLRVFERVAHADGLRVR